jgi:hypothetical protein
MDVLNVFGFFSWPEMLAKRDPLQLDSDPVDEMLYTISEPADVITQETLSILRLLDYSETEGKWGRAWQSDVVTGTASPLPAANRADGYNGGKLLGTNDPVLLLRTYTVNGHSHLYVWRWDAAKKTGEHLKMIPAGGGPERNTDFEADLDVTMADLDNDGIYEVIADNTSGTQVWKWDGSKYTPEATSP